ncbi:MAG: diacylglycerol kinase family lipid kinase, partial [Deltaproteobacteria bacterium]|nr:diacylglycerol kinase family lipid kinase [Deltaproteobacteria bacterium]
MRNRFNPFFIVNPAAGRGSLGREWPDIQNLLSKKLGPVAHRITRGPNDGENATRSALKEGFDLIVAVGGDGTLSNCLNGFVLNDRPVNSKAALGVLPYGTGGDFARYFKIPRKPQEAAAHFTDNKTSVVDIGKVTCRDSSGKKVVRYFINISTAGLVGRVDYWSNRAPWIFGKKGAYVYGSVRSILEYKPAPVFYSANDTRVQSTPIMIMVANGPHFGSGMRPAPKARPNDGLFDVVAVEKLSLFQMLNFFPRLYTGGHVKLPQVKSLKTQKMTMDLKNTKDVVPVETDGDTIGKLPALFEIIPKAIRFKRLG